jgi:tight adherence protein B
VSRFFFAKEAAVALGSVALFLVVFVLASDPASLPHRYFQRYVAYLERKLRNLFLTTSGRAIAFGQAVAVVAAVAAGVIFSSSYALAAVGVALVGPALWLERLRVVRLRAIESKIDGFILTLANALKSTPSLGNALHQVQPLLPAPLDQELELALKEMRVGSSLEQALLNMAGRIRSRQLDAALSGLLIGRQVGGELTKILETTASTLREMARLQGVVRSKTAEGKAQLAVLAVFPALILFLFDTVSRGYFDPLGESAVGVVIVVMAVVAWIASLVLARKVLTVNL